MRLKAVVAPLLLISLLGVAPGPAPVPSADWAGLGVTLGENAAALDAKMGEPYNTHVDGDVTMYLYMAWTGNALEFVHLLHGNVVAVAFYPTDHPAQSGINASKPSVLGVALQDPASTLKIIPTSAFVSTKQLGGEAGIMHVYRDGNFEYVFTEENGFITSVSVYLPRKDALALPPAAMPVLHDGSSITNAIVVMAPREDIGVRFEYLYVGDQRCANDSTWNVAQQSLLHNARRSYDQLDVTCSTDDSSKRSFFFDITNYLGKL